MNAAIQYSALASAPDIVLGLSCLEDAMMGSPSGFADLLGLGQGATPYITAARFSPEEQIVIQERLLEILSGIKSNFPKTQERIKGNLEFYLKKRQREKEKGKSPPNFSRVHQADSIHDAARFIKSEFSAKDYEAWLNHWLLSKRVLVLLHTSPRLEALRQGEDSIEAWKNQEVKRKITRKIRRRYKLGGRLFWGAILAANGLLLGRGFYGIPKKAYEVTTRHYFPELAVSNFYAKDLYGFTQGDCVALPAFDGPQCRLLSDVLGKGPEGIITPSEVQRMLDSGFPKSFVEGLGGEDGKKALNKRIDWLRGNLQGPNTEEILEELGSLRELASQSVPDLIQLIENSKVSLELRLSACSVLEKVVVGNIPKEAIGAILKLAEDDGHVKEVQDIVSRFFLEFGDEAIPFLVKFFEETESPNLFMGTAQALGGFGKKVEPLLPILFQRLRDKSELTCVAVIDLLGHLTEVGPQLVPHLMEALKDSSSDVRVSAIEALIKLGRDAVPAIRPMKKLAQNDPNPNVQKKAQEFIDHLQTLAP